MKYGISDTTYTKGGVSHATNLTTSSITNGVTSRTLYVPLISGVIGHLIPPKSWKLLPGKGCGLMQWEFRLNRYAIFSSGH